jgi:hypothetical protein
MASRSVAKTKPSRPSIVSTLPEDTAFDRLVDLTGLRWRIEARDFRAQAGNLASAIMKGAGGAAHHHATLCIAAYGFLKSPGGAPFPPQDHLSLPLSRSAIPDSYRPRAHRSDPRTHPKLIATVRRRLIVALARTLQDALVATPVPRQ